MDEIPFGYCQCGCGEKTKIAPYSRKNRSWIIGEPMRFIKRHQGRVTSFGKRHTEETKQKMRMSKMAEKNPNWKGDDVGQGSGRRRARELFKSEICENCGDKSIDRHHKDGNTLNNDPSNVTILCRLCHLIEDGRLEILHRNYQIKVKGRQVHDRFGRFLPFLEE